MHDYQRDDGPAVSSRGPSRLPLRLALALALATGPALADGVLRGSARDTQGQPIEDVVVRMIPTEAGLSPVELRSKKNGKFTFGLLRPSGYRLVAFKPGMRISRIDANLAVPDDESLWAVHEDVPPGGELPVFQVTGLSKVTYDLVFTEYDGDPGEYGTGLPVSPVTAVVALIEGGKLDQADTEIRRNLEARPDSPVFHYLAGFLELSRSRPDEALAAVRRCLEVDPGFEGARLLEGRILRKLDQPEAALESFRAELESAQSTEVKRDTTLELALVYQALERDADAVGALERLIALAPDMVDAYRVLADLYVKTGEQDKARAMMEEVRSRGARDPEILYNLAAQHFNSNEFEEAAALFAQVIEVDPGFAEAHLHLGFCRLNLGDQEGAVASLKRFLELSPEENADVETARALVEGLSAR